MHRYCWFFYHTTANAGEHFRIIVNLFHDYGVLLAGVERGAWARGAALNRTSRLRFERRPSNEG